MKQQHNYHSKSSKTFFMWQVLVDWFSPQYQTLVPVDKELVMIR